GEVIIGGRQDRIIGSNTIIPPNTTQNVPVFCVEHGRWQGTTGEFTTANALAHGRLRGRANYDGQQAVWDEVAKTNQARKTETAKLPTPADVKSFIADAEKPAPQPSYETPAAATELQKGDYAAKASLKYKPPAAAPADKKAEKSVYESYQAR